MDYPTFNERLLKVSADLRAAGEALSRSAQRYSHRNGETATPTVAGWYWFDGKAAGAPMSVPTHTGVIRIYVEHGEITVHVSFKDGTRTYISASMSTGQWWGPIIPPWESDA